MEQICFYCNTTEMITPHCLLSYRFVKNTQTQYDIYQYKDGYEGSMACAIATHFRTRMKMK